MKSIVSAAALALAVMGAGLSFSGLAAAETMPPLYDAIQYNDTAKVTAALQNGADVNGTFHGETMLIKAITEKDRAVIRLLLAAPGIDVNKRGTDRNDMGFWTRTPLIMAAGMGEADVVSQLLKMGAQPNAKDASDNTPESRGSTALIKAAQTHQSEAIRVLLTEAKGIDVNVRNRDGKPAIWFVSEAEDFASVKLLREHGAAANIFSSDGTSILDTTIRHKRYDVVDYLIAQGAEINHIDNRALTTLDHAILMLKNSDRRTVYGFIEHFLSFKPNLDLQKSLAGGLGGVPALHLAAQFGHADAVALLLDHGAAIDLKSQARGATALHYAIYADQTDVAKVLIKRKANLELTDTMGATPLMSAKQLRRSDIEEMLTDAGAVPKSAPGVSAMPQMVAPSSSATPVSADKLYGTWAGAQDGIPYAVITLTLNKAGTYSFLSKFTAAALKQYPKGTPPVIAAHQGRYTVTGDVLTLTPASAPPTAMHWTMDGATLVFDNKTRMKKAK